MPNYDTAGFNVDDWLLFFFDSVLRTRGGPQLIQNTKLQILRVPLRLTVRTFSENHQRLIALLENTLLNMRYFLSGDDD